MEDGIFVPSGGDRFKERRTVFGAMQIAFKIAPKDAHNEILLLENVNPGKGGPPRHLHYAQDEWFYVIEGKYDFEIGTSTYHLGPGDCLMAPRNIPHVWAHVGEGKGRILVAFQPAGQMEAFFAEASKVNGTASPEIVRRLFESHGMKLLGPPMPVG